METFAGKAGNLGRPRRLWEILMVEFLGAGPASEARLGTEARSVARRQVVGRGWSPIPASRTFAPMVTVPIDPLPPIFDPGG
jgi:hypothetical protein